MPLVHVMQIYKSLIMQELSACLPFRSVRHAVTRFVCFLCVVAFSNTFSLANTNGNQPQNSSENTELSFNIVDRSDQRDEYLLLRKSIWKTEKETFLKSLESISDYPLTPYLIAQKLQQQLSLKDEKRVRALIDEHKGTPIVRGLRRDWLRLLAKRNKGELFLEFYQPTRDPKLACYALRFKLADGASIESMSQEVAKLWTIGKSQVKACDTVFKKWIKADLLTQDMVLARIQKAADGGSSRLIPYLKGLLDNNTKYLADLWYSVRRNPQYVTNLTRFPQKRPKIESEIIKYALLRLIWRDSDKAIQALEKAQTRSLLTPEQQQQITKKFAIRLVINEHPKALDYLKLAREFNDDDELARWYSAHLLKSQQWQALVDFIESLDSSLKQKNHHKYWLARGYEETKQSEKAKPLYETLAAQRHYYGFLAAARTKKSVALSYKPTNVAQQDIDHILQQQATQRAYELLKIGRFYLARQEWNNVQSSLNAQQRIASGVLASQWDWHDQAIFTFSREGYLDDIERRFPLAYADTMLAQAKRYNLSPDWTFAIARRESSFMSDAVSSANARGLMQVLPSTAKYLEKKRISNSQLLDVELNTKLGNKYLRYLLDKMDDNVILATASYNAGWRRVRQWLPKQHKMQADVWVELIPYRETRNYVKAVFAYQQIYRHHLDKDKSSKPANNQVFSQFIANEIPVSL